MTPLAPALALLLLLATPAHAQPCRRAHALAAGQSSPCACDCIPSPVLDALLTAQDMARRLRVQLDEDAAHAAAALTEARAQTTAAVTAHAADVAAVTRAATARLAAADAHVAALERQVRETVAPVHWTWLRYLGTVLTGVGGAVLLWPCAKGSGVACGGSGALLGVAGGLIVF